MVQINTLIFLSGLQDKSSLNTAINNESDFIKYISSISKKITPNVVVTTFKKKIGNKEFYGYQFLNPSTKIYQKGVVRLINNKIFYQSWIFDNIEDQKTLEEAIFKASFN